MIKLIIYGDTPTAYALANMGSYLNYNCIICSTDPIKAKRLSEKVNIVNNYKSFSGNCAIVIATQGKNDIEALKSALSSKPNFVSMIISKKKAKSILRQLEKIGFSKDEITKVKFPAGLNINAKTPEEIAISILAEIINDRNLTRIDLEFIKNNIWGIVKPIKNFYESWRNG